MTKPKGKKERCRDLVGKRVVLTREARIPECSKLSRDMKSEPSVFHAGASFMVTGTHRGHFTLMAEKAQIEGAPRDLFREVWIPECGFWENPDGSIAWGSEWEPGPYAEAEPVVVEYESVDGVWVPRQAWVKDSDGSIDMHDCDWIESHGCLYYHCAGGGQPYVNAYAEAESLPGRIWIADGYHVVDGWPEDDKAGVPLSDADLLAFGIRRVYGPTPDPLAGATDGDTFYDERTGAQVPDDDGQHCRVCDEQFVPLDGDLVALDDEDLWSDESPGLYFPTTKVRGSVGQWIAPLPRAQSHDTEYICPTCAARAVSDFTTYGLVAAWLEDPEAMPETHREALLDAVRERVDDWVAGYPDYRTTRVHEVYAVTASERLDVPPTDIHRLLEEAGYP